MAEMRTCSFVPLLFKRFFFSFTVADTSVFKTSICEWLINFLYVSGKSLHAKWNSVLNQTLLKVTLPNMHSASSVTNVVKSILWFLHT
jgi:hypothetical protein